MTISSMPQKLISKNDLKNWDRYSENINKYPYVNKYLCDTIKKWVERYDNPLQIPWVLHLYQNCLEYLNESLKSIENKFGEENVGELLKELINSNFKYAFEILGKMYSLNGEMFTFYQLSKKYKTIKKTDTVGDWEGDNFLVSVKTKFDLDFNYEIIENCIISLFYIEENKNLREYGNIRIKGKNIDDKFRNNVILFLQSNKFIELFDDSHFPEQKYNFNTIDFQFSCNDTGSNKDKLKVSVTWGYLDLRGGKFISVSLKNDSHNIEINFKAEKRAICITFPNDVYWEGNKIDRDWLRNYIKGMISKFDKSFEKNKNFIGWVNIFVHHKYEKDVLNNNEEISEILREVIGNKDYEICILFKPQYRFDLKETKIICIKNGQFLS